MYTDMSIIHIFHLIIVWKSKGKKATKPIPLTVDTDYPWSIPSPCASLCVWQPRQRHWISTKNNVNDKVSTEVNSPRILPQHIAPGKKMSAILQITIFKWCSVDENCYLIQIQLICCLGSNWWYVSSGSGNGLMSDWQLRAIIWNNDGINCRHICASLALGEFRNNFILMQF